MSVTTAGERALAQAGTAQTANLAVAETLTVNGVAVTLNAGLSQSQVIDRINEFSAQTGVVAEDNGGNTRLYSSNFGSGATISVVSDVAAAADSSGFGTTAINDTGVDIAGTIDGVAATGVGNTLTAASGASQGLSVQLATDPANATATASGAQGSVTVTNNSLVFQIGANQNQTASVAISRVNPSSLGVGVANNQFASLNDIDVTSGSGAQDAIAVIDASIDDVTNLRGTLGAFQQNTLESTANNLRTTLENTINAESVIRDTILRRRSPSLRRTRCSYRPARPCSPVRTRLRNWCSRCSDNQREPNPRLVMVGQPDGYGIGAPRRSHSFRMTLQS